MCVVNTQHIKVITLKNRTTISAVLLTVALALAGGTGAYADTSPPPSGGEQESTLQVDGYDGFILTVKDGELQGSNGSFSVKQDDKVESLPKKIDAGDSGEVSLSYEKMGDNKLRIVPSSGKSSAQAGSKGTTTNWDKSFDKCVSEAAVEAAGAGGLAVGIATGPISGLIAAAGGALGAGVMAWFAHCSGKPAMKH